ncbi:MAG: hypothetical protein WCK82_12720 [Bacteroidota bacterium]
MDIKLKALELFKEGNSYKKIALALGIGKTTAYDYVKEMSNKPLSTSMNTVRNGSELDSNDFPERKAERSEPKVRSQSIKSVKPSNIGASNVPNTSKIVAITGDELANMKFDTLNFTGKFLELIGKPEKRFSGIIWGLPKGGKSNLSIRFADYLQEYFGNVLYVAAEEGKSVSMQDKIKSIGGSKLNIIQTRNRDEIKEYIKSSSYDFVFIDSINVAGIDNEFLESIKQENPNKSFVAIVQATKGGNFKGDQSLEHNCDFVIKVVNGVAYHKGRFVPESELNKFDEDLYKKNEAKKVDQQQLVVQEKPKVVDSPDFKIEPPLQTNYPIPSNINTTLKTNNHINTLIDLQKKTGSDFIGKVFLIGTGFLIVNEIFKGGKKK